MSAIISRFPGRFEATCVCGEQGQIHFIEIAVFLCSLVFMLLIHTVYFTPLAFQERCY